MLWVSRPSRERSCSCAEFQIFSAESCIVFRFGQNWRFIHLARKPLFSADSGPYFSGETLPPKKNGLKPVAVLQVNHSNKITKCLFLTTYKQKIHYYSSHPQKNNKNFRYGFN